MASIITADTGAVSGSAGIKSSADSSGVLALATGTGTTAVTIDASQNVGIGTSSPAYKLDVSQNTNNDGSVQVTNANTGAAAIASFRAVSSTNTAWFGIGGSSYSAYAQIRANGAAIYTNSGAGIGFSADNASGYITFGTGAGAPERARIDSSGRLLVGTTSVNNGSMSNFYFNSFSNGIETTWAGTSSIYHVLARNGNGFLGGINTSGSTTTYTNLSDYRSKENIAPMQKALEKIALLKPCTFTYKKSGQDGDGFIAHELQEVIPNAVVGEKDAVDVDGNPVYQAVDTSFLVATLTAAIQELNAKFEEYKAAHP